MLVLGFTILGATARAATPGNLRLSEYQKKDWQVEDGLPENNVRMIAQRPDGVLLLATSSGISTFDGQRFESLPLDGARPDNEAVNALLPQGNSELWIGTDGRGVLHRTALGTVNISERAGRFNERIRMLYMDAGGALWIATQNGVERFQADKLEAVAGTGMISGDITAPFAEDGTGGMFFVTSAGLFHWVDGVARRYALRLPASDMPVAVYRDPQRRIWVGTMKHVVELVAGRSGRAPEFEPVVRAAVGGPVTALLGDAAANLWIGTRREGLWRLAPDGLSRWGSRDGLADDSIRSLFLDDEQNLWIGMLTGGLSRWRKGALAAYGDPEGFPTTYSANVLADSHGDLWFGTWGKGLFRRHNGRLISTNPPGMPLTAAIRALAEDRTGQLWVGTWVNGVYRYDGHGFRHYLLGTESLGNAVSAILPDRQGGLWIGTYTGVFHFPSGEPNRLRRAHLLESQLVTCLVEDRDGSVLVGTSTGLYRVRDGKAEALSGLPSPYVLSLTLDSLGVVWASTKGGGLVAVRRDVLTPVPASAGLPAFPINTSIEDGDGHLWLGTSRGIVRVGLADLHAIVEGRQTQLSAVVLGKADGMRSSEVGGTSKPTATRLADGTLWFTTTKGYVHTTDVAERLGTISPVAAVLGWTLSNDVNSWDSMTPASSGEVELEPGNPDVFFFFDAKLLSNPGNVEFRYRLSGYDSAWTYTRARAARYRHLPPGKYRFEVQARGSGEEWSTPVASTALRQQPYLYQTWYFYLALGLMAAAIAVQLFRNRMQWMKGRIGIVLEERSRIASECHDTLMAGFAAISWQLEATAKLFRDSEAESTAAAKSCELARSMVSHTQAEARRIIWDLRTADEVTDSLSQALSRTLSVNPGRETIETTFDLEGEEVPLAPACIHHLVCIGQEAVSNAMRHAAPSRIAVRLKYEADALSLSIRDDGRGFHSGGAKGTGSMMAAAASGARTGHFGIPVMEERARKLGGTFRVQSAAGLGTEVIVRVAFHEFLPRVLPGRIEEPNFIRWIGI